MLDHDDEVEYAKTPQQLELTVHRLRNLKYIPGAVLSLAASSTHLAVARDNGSVELHSDSLRRTHYSIQCPDAVSSMVDYPLVDEDEEDGGKTNVRCRTKFVGALCQMGCFGMIDFTTNSWSHHTASGGGEIYDLCLVKGTDLIAVACQDGSIRFFSLHVDSEKPHSAFDLVHTLPSAGAPVLSLACHRRSGKEDLEGLELYAGVADGTIRQYQKKSVVSGWQCTQRMTVECRGRSVPTQIWTLDMTIDGTLISGDSLGQVQFWRDGVWIASLEQNNNQADVLSVIAVGEDKAFASGVDARVVCLQRNEDHQWIVSQALRPHTHDVMAMALVQDQKKLVTAGVDSKLCSYEVSKWGRRRPVVTYPWPARSPVSIGGRRVVMARNQQVDLYKLNDVQNDENFPQVQSSENHIGTIQVGQRVQHVCLGPNAEFLAVQTAYLRIFRLEETKKGSFRPHEIKCSDRHIKDVVAMTFLENETLIVATASRKLVVLSMPNKTEQEELTVLAECEQEDERTALPVHSIACFGSQWVATLTSEGNQHRAVAVYRFQSDEINLLWTLPDVGSKITAMAFLCDGRLAIACRNFSFYLFDVATRSLDTWSEAAGLPMAMPAEISTRRDYPVHIGVNPATPNVVFLASFGAVVAVDTSSAVPTRCTVVPEKHVRSKKRQRCEEETVATSDEKLGPSCTMCLLYTGMLNLAFIEASEMVVVEQPWLDIVASFPDPLQRHVYGT